jgi:tyrosyl-tRNA synthetase
MKIDTDPKKIEEFLTRGVANIYPNIEVLRKELSSGRRLRIYNGIDPTGKLHIGHGVVLRKMRQLQDLGHEIIVLIGDFTAMIGDPTDKKAARKPLTKSEVKNNAANYKKLIGKILSIKRSKIRFVYNEKWTNKLTPHDLLNLASCFTVPQILERDMFQERMKSGNDLHLNEVLYPLFQAYDSVTMNVDMEIGGNDQTFNMLAGRTMLRKMKGKEKFVLTTKLLTDPTGKKMGKTEGNMINLEDDSDSMFGKIMSWTDGMMMLGFELCTNVSMEEIEKIKQELAAGANPRDIKVRLAKEIITIYHSQEKADKAEQNFVETFKNGGVPENIDEVMATNGELLSDISLRAGVVKSKGEFRRLVLEKAVSNHETNDKITDPNWRVISTAIFKIGKRRFLKVLIK